MSIVARCVPCGCDPIADGPTHERSDDGQPPSQVNAVSEPGSTVDIGEDHAVHVQCDDTPWLKACWLLTRERVYTWNRRLDHRPLHHENGPLASQGRAKYTKAMATTTTLTTLNYAPFRSVRRVLYAITRKSYVMPFRSPSAKRDMRSGWMSTSLASPSRMSSAIHVPMAGDSLKP